MGRLHYRGGRPSARVKKRGEVPRFSKPGTKLRHPQLRGDRKSLLLGTARASTLLIGTLASPLRPAGRQRLRRSWPGRGPHKFIHPDHLR
jgi:hypothetical protein